MTIGQRIAQKRKEQGLSQEALGNQLGVSRQSIYKWESDAALPEIEKLIALSRLFGVPVGWLLGVEEPPPETAEAGADSELTEQQLKMVEEIVGRYLASQPTPKKRRRWPWVLAVLALAAGSLALFQRLDRMDQQVQSLQSSVSQVTDRVGSQISSISQQVEDVLKAQNSLLADYGAELAAVDPAANTATFSLYAVPKTYVEGMSVEFLAEAEETGGLPGVAGEEVSNQRFSAAITVPLTDQINLSVLLVLPDGTRQIQLLDQFDGLYSKTVPSLDVHSNLRNRELLDGALVLGGLTPERYLYTRGEVRDTQEGITAAIAEVRVGLFKNRELVTWAEPCEPPANYQDFDEAEFQFYRLPPLELPLGSEDVVQVAAVVTDEFGRISISPDAPLIPDESDGSLTHPSQYRMERDPAQWTF